MATTTPMIIWVETPPLLWAWGPLSLEDTHTESLSSWMTTGLWGGHSFVSVQ